MRWVQLCSSLSILWHGLSLGLEWKPTFSSPVATAEFSKFAGILCCSTFTASSFRIWNSSTGIPSPPLALFVMMLPKAHLTSHSRMSGVQDEAGQRPIEFCQENALVIANSLFQQHKRRLYTWTSPDGQYQNQIDYILCSQRWRSSIQSAKTRPGADCGSDHELLIAKFRLKLKKMG